MTTVVLASFFPNTSITAYKEDPASWDTEVVESMAGNTFRNARRGVLKRNFSFTLWGREDSAEIQAAVALKEATFGRLYGFKFISLRTGDTIDVVFKSDTWDVIPTGGTSDIAASVTQISVELEEVLDGVPA